MVNIYLFDCNHYQNIDFDYFPQSLKKYLVNQKKNNLSYIAYHLLMKVLKDDYLIDDIIFDFSNKPKIINHRIFFNISHTKNYIAIGITYIDELGVDMESLDREVSATLYERALSDLEKSSTINIEDKKMHFLKCFVMKEAHLKRLGTGFNIHPKEICTFSLDYYPVFEIKEGNFLLCVAILPEQKVIIKSFLDKNNQ